MDGTPRILAAGDQALLIEFGEEIKPAINRRVQAFAQRANQHKIPGIGELVPSYCTALIYYDPLYLSFSQAASWPSPLRSAWKYACRSLKYGPAGLSGGAPARTRK